MNKRMAVIGVNGQLGNDLIRLLLQENSYRSIPLTHQDIEITDQNSIINVLDAIQPDIVINAAAYNKVDEIESNPEKAFLINSLSNKYLASYCNKKNITFVYISSDYVFGINQERKTPYIESDCPGPISAYGISKLAGEYFTRYECEKHFVIRTCGLFGTATDTGKGRNFITSILRIAQEKNQVKVVNDQTITPTYTYDLAKQIIALIKTNVYGLYHASAEGSCTWYEFAKEVFKLTNIKVDLIPISSKELSQPAKRAQYSVLENHNLKNIKVNLMKDWKEGLKEYIKETR